jgi:hypothetical protein
MELRDSHANRADVAIVFRSLKPTVLLDSEGDDLKIRNARKPLAPNLGGTVA